MLGLVKGAQGILFSLGAAIIARLARKCHALRNELACYEKQVYLLAEEVATLSVENTAIKVHAKESESKIEKEMEHMKKNFEEEWSSREQEWESKLSSKDQDAEERLEEIASWQEELGRLRNEAIAIRTAIEKVRSRSSSPGRNSGTESDENDNKENGVLHKGDVKESQNPLRGRSTIRV